MPATRTVVLLSVLLLPASAAAQSAVPHPSKVVQRRVAAGPLRFEANRGQTDPRVRFLARGKGYTLFLTDTEAVFSLNAERNSAALRMSLGGARTPRRIAGAEPLPGKTHYIRGSDSSKWATDVPSFAKVRYEDVYAGIDLVYYGNPQQLEYDYVVAPGADPSAIRVQFTGAERMAIVDQGDLLLRVAQRDVRQLRPVAYQRIGNVRREIPVRYELTADGAVGFELGDYDPTVSVVIDPVLVYHTYLGGSAGSSANAVAADSSGAAYVAGGTTSIDFPTTPGAFRETHIGFPGCDSCDAFVSKFDASGALVYSTYLGGHGANGINDIAVSPAGEAYLVGFTSATDFPTTDGAFQRTCAVHGPGTDRPGTCEAGFVAKLDTAGASLVFSTYLWGGGINLGGYGTSPISLALDPTLNIFLAGTTGPGFPVTAGAYQTSPRNPTETGFVTKMTADGSALLYSTYLGGGFGDTPWAIATDGRGNAYVTGVARSPDFPTTAGAFQRICSTAPVFGFCTIAFVTKINPAGTSLVYSTLLGGADRGPFEPGGWSGTGRGIAVDEYGFAYVTGESFVSDFPTTPGSFKPATVSGNAFVTKLNLDGTGLVYSTYLGGNVTPAGGQGYEFVSDIEVDAVGNAYVAGTTASSDFPQVNSLQPVFGQGTTDAFVSVLNASGSALTFSTYLGGSRDDISTRLAFDAQGDLLVTGGSGSFGFPPSPDSRAGFVAKIGGLSSCGTEVTGQVDVLRSGFLPIFWPFNLQLAIVWNRADALLNGPLAYVMDDLQHAVFVGPSKTRCLSPDGDPVTTVPLTGEQVLAPNEARLLGLWFFQTQLAPITYVPRLISGPRNR